MARVTIEDCLQKVNDRFELVILATKRAREIAMGAQPLVNVRNDKDEVIALREIAAGYINVNRLRLNTILDIHHAPNLEESTDETSDHKKYEGVTVDYIT